VEVRGLTHRYAGSEFFALDGVSFSVTPGERLGLLGPNGAGKTTLMRLLCGYLPVQARRPDTHVRVGGFDVKTQSLEVRRRVGYLPEQVPLYGELRVREFLAFRCQMKRVPRRYRVMEAQRTAELTGLLRVMDTPIQTLSRGYRQRVGIADALLGSPPLVILDEPTVGLDPNQVQSVRAMLRDLGGAQTLIFSSHILAEVEDLCDRIVVLSKGSVVADQSVREAMASNTVSVELCMGVGDARALVERAVPSAKEGVRIEVSPQGEWTHVDLHGVDADVAQRIGQMACEASVPIRRLERKRRALETHFARVTGADGGGPA
ncbi:MAG: ABC transporter ATP-binding protein, partial [Nannocystaceae bacterium]